MCNPQKELNKLGYLSGRNLGEDIKQVRRLGSTQPDHRGGSWQVMPVAAEGRPQDPYSREVLSPPALVCGTQCPQAQHRSPAGNSTQDWSRPD